VRLYSRCCALLRQARRSGKPLPPLFCVPVLVKDNFDTVGMVATAGSIALMDNFPQRDAQPVRPGGIALLARLCPRSALFALRHTGSGGWRVRLCMHGAPGKGGDRALAEIGAAQGGRAPAPVADMVGVGLGRVIS